MFNSPTRNHFTLIFERLGAFGVLLLTMAYSFLFRGDNADIFSVAYWRELKFQLLNSDNPASVIGKLAVVAGATVVLFISVFAWRKTFFYIEGESLIFEKKTMFSRSSKLPISQIATVNLERNVFERLVGTAKVKLDINSSVTANKTDFIFILTHDKAKLFEAELMRVKSAVSGAENTEKEPREQIVYFEKSKVVRHVLLSTPIVQVIVSLATLLGATAIDGRVELSSTLSAVGLIAAGYVFTLVMQVLNASDFRVERDSKNIYLSSGALRKKNYSFELDKINAVMLRQPLLARVFGLCSVDIAVVGLGNDKKELPQICLLATSAEAQEIIKKCAPDFICTGEKIKSPRQGLLMSFISAFMLCVVPAILMSIYVHFAFAFLFAALAAAGAYFSYTAKSLNCDDRIFSYSKGVFGKVTGFFKYEDIQTAKLVTNFLLKGSRVGRIKLSILSAAVLQNHETGYFDSEQFSLLESRIMR